MTLRGSGLPTAVLGSGETLLFGRSPTAALPEVEAEQQLRYTALPLPRCAPHVSRLLGELVVGEEMVRLRWRGGVEAQLSSLFDAPGGARRVTLVDAMSALLDEGENRLVVLRGRQQDDGSYGDLTLAIDVAASQESTGGPAEPAPAAAGDADASPTATAPGLAPGTREWFVALALAEPWLSGADDYPRPPSNREVYERVRHWHGYAWNLERPQRVDDAIRAIAGVAFGPKDDPFRRTGGGRVQNVRFAVGRRAAEVRLVTVDDLDAAEQAAAARDRSA
ncbi:hypothetical protein [Jatrophihabitans endophyticus]|uniref:hypothetical protein n=1 Tax=Jatrophihabitans endophyticus TaxID=1206085 RepID=UPI00190E94E0|nr:hypothetical protein [Jatrophihabitans endophyticus]